jgi:hypothetical protein
MKRTAATLLGAAALATVPSAAHAADQAGAILGAINTERQMAGIDALTVNQDWATGCSAHTSYMAANNLLTHDEAPSASLFSDDGQWAGAHAVLARSSSGFTGNPWAFAPLHEFQVLHPWLRETGVAVKGQYACMVTLGTRDAPNAEDVHLVTSPGFGQYHRPAEIAKEAPFVPDEELGLPAGTKTGPHIYVYAVGPQRIPKVVIQSAVLTAQDTGVETPLQWVDSTSSRSGSYLDGGAILVPAGPLRENVTYGLRVQASAATPSGGTMLISRTTSFITGPDESDLRQVPDTNDTVRAATATTATTTSKVQKRSTTLTLASGAKVRISLKWTGGGKGVKTRIICLSKAANCEGPVRVLVRKRGSRLQKLKFRGHRGALTLNLKPGQRKVLGIKLSKGQRHSAHKRGFAVRWGAGTPAKLPKPRGWNFPSHAG